MIESFFIAVLLTAVSFAALQLCIVAVDDLICNEAAFTAVRTAVIAETTAVERSIRRTVEYLLLPHSYSLNNIVLDTPRYWDNEPLEKGIRDHSGVQVRKYNANIPYHIRVMFGSLLKPSLAGGAIFLSQTARARMIKSPDENYYYRAYPGARLFTGEGKDEEQ